MSTYSLLDIQGSLSGPNGSFSLGSDSGVAEEGITIEPIGEKDTLTMGGGGAGMHSLHGSNAYKVTYRCLKTSPTNALLSAMYAADKADASTWGQNLITFSDTYRGDRVTLNECAFVKHGSVVYATEGGMMEWEFNCINGRIVLGAGVPDVNV